MRVESRLPKDVYDTNSSKMYGPFALPSDPTTAAPRPSDVGILVCDEIIDTDGWIGG